MVIYTKKKGIVILKSIVTFLKLQIVPVFSIALLSVNGSISYGIR